MRPLQTGFAPLSDTSALESRWRDLETRADRAFFLSWAWIGSWVDSLEARPWLLEVTSADGRTVALGLFCEARETRKRVIRARQLRLHETGDPARDVITIEYNALLTERGMEEAAWFAAIKALQAPGTPRWDELVIGGATGQDAALFSRLGLGLHRRAETTSAFVDLAKLRAAGIEDAEGYITTLGKSTRSQLRRSMKLYRERGDLALDAAGSLEEAQAFLAELGPHHNAKWNAQGRKGATEKPEYLAFHDRLMRRAYGALSGEVDAGSQSGSATGKKSDGEVEFLRARAGDQPFGWLYNFIDRGRVLFYLSGFVFDEDNRLKPGLVTHALAIERHLKRGMDVYDFMGGGDRYKSNLGEAGPDIVAYALQRRTPMMLLEGAARSLKARLSKE